MRPRNCVTHHFACDCREAAFQKLVEALDGIVAESHSWVIERTNGALLNEVHRKYRNRAISALRAFRGEEEGGDKERG